MKLVLHRFPMAFVILAYHLFYSNDNDTRASMWSSTGDDIGAAWLVVIYSSSDKLNRYSFSEGFGFSVRCVKD